MSKTALLAALLLAACGGEPRSYPTAQPKADDACWDRYQAVCLGTMLECQPVDHLRDGGVQRDPESVDLQWVDTGLTCQ